MSKCSKLLNERTAVTTVSNLGGKRFAENALLPTLFKHTVEIDTRKLSGRSVIRSRQRSTVLAPVRL